MKYAADKRYWLWTWKQIIDDNGSTMTKRKKRLPNSNMETNISKLISVVNIELH